MTPQGEAVIVIEWPVRRRHPFIIWRYCDPDFPENRENNREFGIFTI
jgi:hypothetical protein